MWWKLTPDSLKAVADSQKKSDKFDIKNAEHTRYSPWTGVTGSLPKSQGATGGALGGAMLAQAFTAKPSLWRRVWLAIRSFFWRMGVK